MLKRERDFYLEPFVVLLDAFTQSFYVSIRMNYCYVVSFFCYEYKNRRGKNEHRDTR